MCGLFLLLFCCQLTTPPVLTDSQQALILTHSIENEYQSGVNELRVVLPEPFDANRRYRVVYLLPVEPKREHRYGDALHEIVAQKLYAKHEVIFAAMTFSDLPWYADHPTNLQIRQESYLLQAVIPWLESHYPVITEREGRLLLGFSKSGFGAWSLLLRNPETFERAAAWDAPLMLEAPGKYGSGPIFGGTENFARYRLDTLLQQQETRESLATAGVPRLILSGYDNFRHETQAMHRLLVSQDIPHLYRDGPRRPHHWHSGWVAESLELLLQSGP